MRTLISSLVTATIAIALLIIQSCEEENNEPANQTPTCSITNLSSGDEIPIGETVTISVEAEDEDGNLKEVRFYIDNIGMGYSEKFPHNFEWETAEIAEGFHMIKVVALDEDLAMSKDSVEVVIIKEGVAPVAKFSVDYDSIVEGASIQFADESTGEPTEWKWHFGDGKTSIEKNPVHSYSSEGRYSVLLIVSNTHGSDDIIKTNYIKVENSATGTFTDPRDGQIYKTIEIGNQVWFAENLNYETEDSWWYENDPLNGEIYGRLYTWNAAMGACPDGWHLPSDEEWSALEAELGMEYSITRENNLGGSNIGEQMKSTTGWDNNGNGTNSSGFSALPGGRFYNKGLYQYIGNTGIWWTASVNPFGSNSIYARRLHSEKNNLGHIQVINIDGVSVRCLKD